MAYTYIDFCIKTQDSWYLDTGCVDKSRRPLVPDQVLSHTRLHANSELHHLAICPDMESRASSVTCIVWWRAAPDLGEEVIPRESHECDHMRPRSVLHVSLQHIVKMSSARL